ncbi:MAG: hypothetical protein ACI4RG_05720, partial [Huintestinicola sp.]
MSGKTNFRRILSAVLAVLVSVPLLSANLAFAGNDDVADITEIAESADTAGGAEVQEAPSEQEDAASSETAVEDASLFVKQKTYSDYYDEIAGMARPSNDVPLTFKEAKDGADVEIGSYEGKDNVIIWSNEEGTLDFTVDVPVSGAYNIAMSYYPIVGNTTVSEVSVLIDGESPFDCAARINIPRVWTSKYPITQDSKDNDIRPPQVEAPMWTTTSFKDEDGLFNQPLYFALE